MKESASVYVITLNWNGKELLDDCLSSLLAMDYPNFKVIMVDNGSQDDSVSYVKSKFQEVEILENGANLGYSEGFNVGLDYAFNQIGSDYVMVINNDVKVDKHVLAELVKVAETDEKIGFVTGKVYYFDSPDILQSVGKKYDPVLWNGGHIGNQEKDIGQYEEICERYFADDIYTLINSKLYKEIGGYDVTFRFQSEEYDWQARAKEAGYKIMYTPYAKIWHKDSMTIGKRSAFKAYYDSRNPMLIILKHKPPEFFRRYFWLHLRRHIFRGSLVSMKNFDFAVAFKKWQGTFSGIWWGLKNRKITYRHLF
jgi:GT2 family glycosyltransferase